MNKKLGLWTILGTIGLVTVLVASHVSLGFGTGTEVFGDVENAFYADIDQVGDIEDIQWDIRISVESLLNESSLGVDIVTISALEYPNTSSVWYETKMTVYQPTIEIHYIFYNHATDLGNYTAHLFSMTLESFDQLSLQGTLYSSLMAVVYEDDLGALPYGLYYSELVFDPPGGVGGTPPLMVPFSDDNVTIA